MIKAYYTATNGALSSQNYLDVLSNNMANMQTEGFKRSKPEFSDLLYTNIRGVQGENTDLKSGSGAKISKVDVIHTQGAPVRTGVPTDFAIQGDGFFAVQFEEENMFTRGGSFELTNIDGEKYLTFQGGYVLNEDEEPIIVENVEDINVGVFIFSNRGDLAQAGGNLFRIANDDAEYNLFEEANVAKGFLEASNVEMSEEMIKLIQTQKSFQLNSSVIKTADEIEQTINALRG
ncbi:MULTISPECIES: flagellar hook-basal body protein [unclassified Sedimentibacter]|uniref:flagellar hook-basal body protein n=1 Tax=unclassified Sedimentibacter TaxID=2649220 RepID=UPI0027E0F31D|nr:flagellar hook-basal body protein [Sedimentibacter sp. MB35-C1]WMJ78618.1 flagellar hook-basal body protein [Sedimentibacter sp. MB35-C1]